MQHHKTVRYRYRPCWHGGTQPGSAPPRWFLKLLTEAVLNINACYTFKILICTNCPSSSHVKVCVGLSQEISVKYIHVCVCKMTTLRTVHKAWILLAGPVCLPHSECLLPPFWVVFSIHALYHHLGCEKKMDHAFCRLLMMCLPSQMVTKRDSHKSGPGSSEASVWGQPHYRQSGPLPGCRDVSVYGLQHCRSYTEQESKSTVCL